MIHVFGDSHAALFSGVDERCKEVPNERDTLPEFRTYDMGPVLAYNFVRFVQDRERLFQSCKRYYPADPFMFYFGEIDIRVHIVEQAEKQQRSILDIVQEVVDRYIEGLKMARDTYGIIHVFGPHPQYKQPIGPLLDFHYGTYEEIYWAGETFNGVLENRLPPDIKFATLFHEMMKRGMNKVRDYYMDDFHIKPTKMLPLAMEKLREAGIL